MASGSSGRNNPGSKGFDFASDDILCSYEDYNQDASNGSHSEPPIGSNSGKEFHKSRMARSSMFPAPAYSPPDESSNHEVILAVEKTMKKHSDNLMRFLEGLSSRLSQLELYCYNLDKSISEMRSDLNRDHGEQDSKLKSMEKHLQEVHRSVQILRDKQELAETQKELAKLQHSQKESASTSHSHQNEERAAPPSSEAKKPEVPPDVQGQQLALALPHQVTRPVEQQQPIAPSQPLPQSQAYYLPPAGLQNPQQSPPPPQYLQSDPQYRTSHLQDMSRPGSQPVQNHGNQAPPQPPQYQQQWPQQQPPSVPPQNRVPPGSVYPPYLPGQPSNNPPPPQETLPSSMGMQVAYSGIPQHGSRADATPYGFGGPGRTMPPQQPPPQQMKANFGVQANDGYNTPQFTQGNAYMMYDGEGGNRAQFPHQPPQFSQASYPPSVPLQSPQAANTVNRPQSSQSSFMRNNNNNNNNSNSNNPYGELIEKLVTMGYRGDHVAGVIQRMEESGQPIDFNAVLDRLNGHPPSSIGGGSSQRGGWSG